MTRGASILVVEDENIVAMDIRAQLQKLGYRVVGTAGTAADAIAGARAGAPDLVLMDINLRGAGDGIEAAETIRAELHVPVIFLTAYSDPAIGIMRENADGAGEFTSIVLRPQVTISDGSRASEIEGLHHEAHKFCFVARSVNFPIRHEGVVTVEGGV